MHIPNSMLAGNVCPVTSVLSVLVMIFAAWKAFFAKKRPGATRFASITALIFAGQMMNFPINNGTSGHLLGGVLAVALLGIPFGILSIALVVTIQCLVFSDGGFSVLGANILNMAVIGAGLGGIIYTYLTKKVSLESSRHFMGLGIAAWFSLMMAALACSIELAISGTIPFRKVIGSMLGIHAIIGIGESLITVGLCVVLAYKPIKISEKKSSFIPITTAGIIAFILSPFASGLPDGLEWVAQKYNFLHESAPMFVSPFQDYTFPAVGNEILSIGFAGLFGVIITFCIAWTIAKPLEQKI